MGPLEGRLDFVELAGKRTPASASPVKTYAPLLESPTSAASPPRTSWSTSRSSPISLSVSILYPLIPLPTLAISFCVKPRLSPKFPSLFFCPSLHALPFPLLFRDFETIKQKHHILRIHGTLITSARNGKGTMKGRRVRITQVVK